MSYWTAARLYRDIGAVNAETIALVNILTTFPGIDPARPTAWRTLPLAGADAAVLRATTDERVHPEVCREVAATLTPTVRRKAGCPATGHEAGALREPNRLPGSCT